ncbi:MAG: vitamin K epoxide reductase family protein [Spirulinaceae cyanobacterium SM2_1_0]|nr:vitamin K epoxide reductase family protein [Spirulinaceae cyanobacterium SM2_1_0]
MTRRRSSPWIHRWSRLLIGGIATLGATLTAYLTVVKLTGAQVGCIAGEASAAGIGSCDDVLSSPYAQVFGLPLSLFGALAYVSMAVFALGPLAVNRDRQKELRNRLEEWSWLLLLVGATSMAVFSGYLMYLLAFELQTVCVYCITSATFAVTFLALTILGRHWEDIGQVLFTGVVVALVTLVGTLGVYAGVNNPAGVATGGVIPQPQGAANPRVGGWEITTESGPAEIALAAHLTEAGAKKYGAFWCPHCYDQKQLFGKEAFSEVNYIECEAGGKDAQPELCTEAGVTSYPTWEIDGELYPGTQLLTELAELTDYQVIPTLSTAYASVIGAGSPGHSRSH